jgi:hypothetical protein
MGEKPVSPGSMVEAGGIVIRTLRRLGDATDLLGSGGSALNYTFDPSTGLSNDPALPVYLQNLTPGQLQTALSPDPSGSNTLASSQAMITALQTGAGLPCGTPANPTCGPAPSQSPIPSWIWIGGVALLAGALVLGGRK